MSEPNVDNPVVVLNDDESWELLGTERIGRLARAVGMQRRRQRQQRVRRDDPGPKPRLVRGRGRPEGDVREDAERRIVQLPVRVLNVVPTTLLPSLATGLAGQHRQAQLRFGG